MRSNEILIDDLIDYIGSLKDLQSRIQKLINEYGEDAQITVDAGYNNVQFIVTLPQKKK